MLFRGLNHQPCVLICVFSDRNIQKTTRKGNSSITITKKTVETTCSHIGYLIKSLGVTYNVMRWRCQSQRSRSDNYWHLHLPCTVLTTIWFVSLIYESHQKVFKKMSKSCQKLIKNFVKWQLYGARHCINTRIKWLSWSFTVLRHASITTLHTR